MSEQWQARQDLVEFPVILSPLEMHAAEDAVFAQGVSPEALMEKAGLGIAEAIRERWPTSGTVVAYLGKGNNGGDALVAARHLQRSGWRVVLRDVEPNASATLLSRKKRAECLAEAVPLKCHRARPLILLDGLLGIGASGPLRPAYRACNQEMNQRRLDEGAFTVALDIPTGLDGITGEAQPDTVEADLTLTIAYGKPGLLADMAEPYVGALALIPLPEITAPTTGGDRNGQLLTADLLHPWRKRRQTGCFKNQTGRVILLAGSEAFAGAAVLTAKAALSAGAGLVTLCVPAPIMPLIAPRLSPEIMLRSIPSSTEEMLDLPADVIGIGPGLGPTPPVGLLQWLASEPRPIVVDADGLNLLARHLDQLTQVAETGPRLFTPHPGEFRRLFPIANQLTNRRLRAERVTKDLPITLLYKGARSLIAESNRPISYNLTGNPGMASGGMGDVLTGICTGLAAQGHSLYEAASLGAWLCGRAADLAIASGEQTQETLRATHVLQTFPKALSNLA